MNSQASQKLKILGVELDEKNFPVLFKWAKNHPDTFKQQVQAVAEAWHEGDIMSACQALESDMEHSTVID